MKLRIEPGGSSRHYWRDIWSYRELMYFLAWRDLSVRYKQTVLGVAWAVLRPGFTMLIFVAFRRLTNLPSSSVPDPILVLAAVLPWQFFSSSLGEISACLVGNANLISKVYFPRLIVPIASMATGIVDFLVTLCMLALVMAWYGYLPSANIIFLPLLVLLTGALALGLGLFLAALNVEYRDFRYVVPFVIQLGLFVSPVAFTTADVPEAWRAIYAINPLVGIIEGFRWCIVGGPMILQVQALVLSCLWALAGMALGVFYFRRLERGFADVI